MTDTAYLVKSGSHPVLDFAASEDLGAMNVPSSQVGPFERLSYSTHQLRVVLARSLAVDISAVAIIHQIANRPTTPVKTGGQHISAAQANARLLAPRDPL